MAETKPDQFVDLTWDDLEEWAGSKILSRGKRYQSQNRVCELAVTKDEGLVAWVDGTIRYATKVVMSNNGVPISNCTCPYEFNCKHAVAVLIEYLKRIQENHSCPRAKPDDARLILLENKNVDWNLTEAVEDIADNLQEVNRFLQGKTKSKIIELILEISRENPEIIQEFIDRKPLTSGHVNDLVPRLRREIQEISKEPGWQNYWEGTGYVPDYSGIRKKLERLLEAGYPDEVLTLGEELISCSFSQIEESHDDGETCMEVASCMPVIVKALDQSTLDPVDKLNWAVNADLEDGREVCEAFVEYLYDNHPESAWNNLADRLLLQLQEMHKSEGREDFHYQYERDQLSEWAIHALDQAGREEEIIHLCEAEAEINGNYGQLVDILVSGERYVEAEHWILEGIRAAEETQPGTANGLRNTFLEIRTLQEDWPVVAALQTEEFVRNPSQQNYQECQKAAARIKALPEVSKSLLEYLEKGELPWRGKDWHLPKSGLKVPEAAKKDSFPRISHLIDIAIMEEKPAQVLYWYDYPLKYRYGSQSVDDDKVATAVQTFAPDRAVTIWKCMAEELIALVKPAAYRGAKKYLRKAARVMATENRLGEWNQYLQRLRMSHVRKTRLIEILDAMDEKPIINSHIP